MDQFNRLLRMAAFKPRIFKGLPENDVGENGDFGLAVTATGLILYIKYNNIWWHLIHGKKAAARGEGREIGAYKDTFHATANVHRLKWIARRRRASTIQPQGSITYTGSGDYNSGFNLGDGDNINITGSGVLKFSEQTVMSDEDIDRDVIIIKRDNGVLKFRNADDTDDITIEAKKIHLNTGAAAGEDKEFRISYDDDNYVTFTVNLNGILKINDTHWFGGSSFSITNGVVSGLDGTYAKIGKAGIGTNSVLELYSVADKSDYFYISTGVNGSTVISTIDESAASANLQFLIDGDIQISSVNGNTLFYNPVVTQYFSISVAGAGDGGKTTLSTLDASPSTEVADLILAPDGDCIIDRNTTKTATATSKGLHIDYDHTGISASGQTITGIGLDLDMNCESVTHVGTVNQTGIDIDMVAADDGTQTNTGIDLNVSGADTNEGLVITNADGGTDIKLVSSADSADYCTISTTASGATTLATVDDGAAVGHLTLNPDGNMIIGCNPGGSITLQENDASTYTPSALSDATTKVYVDSKQFTVHVDKISSRMSTVDYFYVSNNSLGSSIAASDFGVGELQYAVYTANSAVKLKSWRFVGYVSSTEPYTLELWDVTIPSTGSSTAATVTRAATQNMSLGDVTANRIYNTTQTDIDYALAAAHQLYFVTQYTDGSGTKNIYGTLAMEFEVIE